MYLIQENMEKETGKECSTYSTSKIQCTIQPYIYYELPFTIPHNMSKKPVLVIIQIVYLLSVSCLLKNNDNVNLSKSSWHWNRHQLCSFIQTRITWLPITTICGRLIASEPIVLNTSWSLLITGISPSISNITLHSIWFWSVRFS